VPETSDNLTESHAHQRRLLHEVIDPDRARSWLVERIIEHAQKLIEQNGVPDGDGDPVPKA
jgi:hypothetical protein